MIPVPSPSLVFSFILATFYGASAHVIVGGDARRLALLLVASWSGFAFGQVIGELLAITIMTIGPLHTASATLGAWMALIFTWFLSRRPPDTEVT